jgi:uncharacterized membrane protein (UPF0127 family)
MKRILLGVLAVVGSRGACAAGPPEIPLKLPSGKVLTVEVMANDQDRAMGVMYRDSLPKDRGLLFVFEEPSRLAFWMKNCKFPIDMVWIDADKKIVDVTEKAPPCTKDPCPTFSPISPALYVLEINALQARAEKAVTGAKVEFKLRP